MPWALATIENASATVSDIARAMLLARQSAATGL